MQSNYIPTPSETRYKSMRWTLLLILIFSALNIFSLLGNRYFLFSTYLSQVISVVGVMLYRDSGEIFFFILSAILALISLVPYLLCFIFSKKKAGWMIGALAFFAFDSVLFVIDLISYPMLESVFDVIIRIYALVSLVLAVKYGTDAKKEVAAREAAEKAAAEAAEAEKAEAVEGDADGESAEPAERATRTLTIRRKKAFVACAATVTVYVNGVSAAVLKNGTDASLSVPAGEFKLDVALGMGGSVSATNSFTIPASESALDYTVIIKMGMVVANLSLVPTASLKK